MGKKIAAVWDRLAGKTVCFQGRFNGSLRERQGLLAQAQGATVCGDVTAKVNLVVVEENATKAIQKQVLGLNAKGAAIQVVNSMDFAKLAEPTDEQVLAAIKLGQPSREIYNDVIVGYGRVHAGKPTQTIAGESFAGVDVSGFRFGDIIFDSCDFSGATLHETLFTHTKRCNFDRVEAVQANFFNTTACTFRQAKLWQCQFNDTLADLDFTNADLSKARIQAYFRHGAKPQSGLIFRGAKFAGAVITHVHLAQADFEGADLNGLVTQGTTWDGCNLRRANLSGAMLNAAGLTRCDLTGANLRDAKLAEADLSGSTLDGADLTGANLRGAKLNGVDLSKAKGYDPAAQQDVVAGPAMNELDALVNQSKRITFSFELDGVTPDPTATKSCGVVSVDSNGLTYGWAVRTNFMGLPRVGQRNTVLSTELISAVRMLGEVTIRFDTLKVATTKCPKPAKEARDLVIRALCELFKQPAPDAEKLAASLKQQRAKAREANSEQRKAREEKQKQAEAAKIKETKKIERKIEKAVGGKVTDIAGFLQALELRADAAKIDKATKMLKAERFKLFNDITDSHMSGVVKSQTDPDLVYACRIEANGQYACCTQNLNICGGLRGSICKHLLVLIIGLVKAGELDPSTIDGWVAKTRETKPELDKEKMGEIFIRYKGAEAGEVDWRPTETVPEDYYAL